MPEVQLVYMATRHLTLLANPTESRKSCALNAGRAGCATTMPSFYCAQGYRRAIALSTR